jgi:hypothetical protein
MIIQDVPLALTLVIALSLGFSTAGAHSVDNSIARACNSGDLAACRYLGIMYYYGGRGEVQGGVEQDLSRALALLKQACDGGDAIGCRYLAVMYYVGRGVEEDRSRALALYKQACDGGDAHGCDRLAEVAKEERIDREQQKIAEEERRRDAEEKRRRERFEREYPGLLREYPSLAEYASELQVIHGNRFSVRQGLGTEIWKHIANQIPKSQYVDYSFYRSMEGLDGSTTLQALAQLRKLYIGKYYDLHGDVFQIQADRDYPREGLNAFSVFGRERLADDYCYAGLGDNRRCLIARNVDCISAEKVPPYRIAPMLTRIVNFRLGQNRAGKAIIIPVVQVIVLASLSTCCNYPDEIIINQSGNSASEVF